MDVTDHGPVRVLTFDRPEKLNALDAGLADRATAALRAADDDPAVATVVLTGSGRAFCAGVDLDHLAAIEKQQGNTDAAKVLLDKAIQVAKKANLKDARKALRKKLEEL